MIVVDNSGVEVVNPVVVAFVTVSSIVGEVNSREMENLVGLFNVVVVAVEVPRIVLIIVSTYGILVVGCVVDSLVEPVVNAVVVNVVSLVVS